MSLSYVLSDTKPRSTKPRKTSKHVKYESSISSETSESESAASTYTVSTSTGRSHRPGYKRHRKQAKKTHKPLDEVVDDYRRAPDGNSGWKAYEEIRRNSKGEKVGKDIIWERIDDKGHKHIKTFSITKSGSGAKHRKDSFDDSGLGSSISSSSDIKSELPLQIARRSSRKPANRVKHRKDAFDDSGLGSSISSGSESESEVSLYPKQRSSRRPARTHDRHRSHRHHRDTRSRIPGKIREKTIRIPQQPKTNIVLKAGKNIYMGDSPPEPKRHSRHSNHRRDRKRRHRSMHEAAPHAYDRNLIRRRRIITKESWTEPRFKWLRPWSQKDVRKDYEKSVHSDAEWEYEVMDWKKGKGLAGGGKGEAPARPGEYLKRRGSYRVLRAT